MQFDKTESVFFQMSVPDRGPRGPLIMQHTPKLQIPNEYQTNFFRRHKLHINYLNFTCDKANEIYLYHTGAENNSNFTSIIVWVRPEAD